MAAAKRQRFIYDVFISYSHRDADWVRGWLVPKLKEAGLSVCIDHESFAPGAPSVTEMERAVRQSRKTVAVLTPAYLDKNSSGWTDFENMLVQTLDPNAREGRLLPVLLTKYEEIPLRLAHLTRLDFTATTERERTATLERLVTALRQRLPSSRQRASTVPIAVPFEVPTGTLSPDSAVYIERQFDRVLQQQVGREGSTTHIEGARQMGKSSLIQRAMAQVRAREYRVIDFDFQLFDGRYLENLETFLRSLADAIHDRLKLAATPDETWRGPLGAKTKLTTYLGDYVLRGAVMPTVLVMDEVDRVFGRDYQNDFFGLLRAWHNQRARDPLWRNFHLVLAYANDPRAAITDLQQSPFNVGTTIRLEDFTLPEVREVNHRYGRPLKSTRELQWLMDTIGGHPYLVQQALYALATRTQTLSALLDASNAESGPFADHLQAHAHRLDAAPESRQAMVRVLRNGQCPTREAFLRLRAMGLVTGRNHHAVTPRCRLYDTYFHEVLL